MRIGLSWLREHVDLPADLSAATLEQALVGLGIEVESIVDLAGERARARWSSAAS